MRLRELILYTGIALVSQLSSNHQYQLNEKIDSKDKIECVDLLAHYKQIFERECKVDYFEEANDARYFPCKELALFMEENSVRLDLKVDSAVAYLDSGNIETVVAPDLRKISNSMRDLADFLYNEACQQYK